MYATSTTPALIIVPFFEFLRRGFWFDGGDEVLDSILDSDRMQEFVVILYLRQKGIDARLIAFL